MRDLDEMVAGQDTTDPDRMPDQEIDRLRAGTWNLLGNLLGQPPDDEVLGLLRGAGNAGDTADPVARAWQELRVAAEQARPDTLAREYQDVFIGVGAGEVIPYASYYRTGSLMEKPLIQLRRELATLGVEKHDGISEPEDHAGAVCEAMAITITDPDVSIDWQKSFHEQHVASWMGDLFSDVRKAPSAVFYRAVGGLGEAFLEFERRYFSMLT